MLKKLFIICLLCILVPFIPRGYSSQDVKKSVQYGKILRFYVGDLKRFLNTTPKRIAVQKTDKDTLEVSTIGVGKGVLLVWTKEGRYVFLIDVVPPPKPVSKKSIEKDFQRIRENYFVFEANMYYDIFESKESGISRSSRADRQTIFNRFNLEGPTFFGRLGATVNVLYDFERDDFSTNSQHAYLKDGNLFGLKNFDLVVGDFSQRGQTALVPSLRLRGARISNHRAINYGGFVPDHINLFSGKLQGGSLYSGIILSPFSFDKRDIYYSGFKLGYERMYPENWFKREAHNLNSLLVRVPSGDDAEDETSSVLYTHRTIIGKKHFDFEVLDFDVLSSFSARYADQYRGLMYDVNARVIPHLRRSSFSSQIGKRMLNLGASYNIEGLRYEHFSLERINSKIDFSQDYVERKGFDGYSPTGYRFQFDLRGKVVDTFYRTGYRLNELSEQISSSRQKEWNIYLSRYFQFYRKIKLYMGYKNRKSENFVTRTSDETSQNFNWGLSFRPLKKVRAFYYASNTASDDAAGQKKFESLSNNIGISYGTRLTNLLSSNFVLLRTETENRSFLNNDRNERDELSFDVRLNYLFKRFPGEVYLRTNYTKVNEKSPDVERDEYSIKMGMNMKFGLFPGLMPKAAFEGHVFKDINANGYFDEADIAIPNAAVLISDRVKARTDENGYFSVEHRAIKAEVSLETRDVPKGYTYSTLSLYRMKLKSKEVYQCDFGFVISNQIWGNAFADYNGNGVYDKGQDRAFGDIRISLQNAMVTKTGRNGLYSFSSLSVGDYLVTLDYRDLPLNFYSKTKLKQDVTMGEGEVVNVPFVFEPERTLVGLVFIDKDGNGILSEGDEPVKGAVVYCAGKKARTSKKGKYVLKRLPAGSYMVSLDETTIDPALSVTDNDLSVELPQEPSERSGMDFVLTE